ncbi:MAG: hypothetical protein M3Z25_11560, partial [Actinomycetota bacterium]|nr:hypothetical protein [Actinomycetota bacterium]
TPPRHAEHTRTQRPPTSPTSLNVTAGEQPQTNAETTHLPGIGRAVGRGVRFDIPNRRSKVGSGAAFRA